MENTQYEDFSSEDGIRIKIGYTHNPRYYNLFDYQYYNLDSFLKALITLSINDKVFRNAASIYEDYDFTKTNSFEEAWNLCRFGMDEGYQKFVNGLNHINFKQSEFEKEKKNYKCIGYVPNVPRFLNGNPNNMKIQQKQIVRSSITIKVQVSYSSSTDKEAVINRGICILNLINYLERHNFDCILQLESISVYRNEMIKISVPIKRDNEKLNIKLSYFPLVHPSFLRRLIFRGIEIIPNLSAGWSPNYGYPYKLNDFEIAALENTIYVSTPSEMNIYGYNLDTDFENFTEYINQKYHIYDQIKKEENPWKKTYGKRL